MTYIKAKPVGMTWAAWKKTRTCTQKRRYDHEGQARREAHQRGLAYYKCTVCDGWHLTSRKNP